MQQTFFGGVLHDHVETCFLSENFVVLFFIFLKDKMSNKRKCQMLEGIPALPQVWEDIYSWKIDLYIRKTFIFEKFLSFQNNYCFFVN